MMEHVVRLLAAVGIDDLEVLLHFYPEKISTFFGDGTPWGVRMNYVNAEADYGTAGAVKNAEERLSNTFLVISADIITDFDLSKAIDFHKERGAAVTIVLTRVPNPLQYGIVITEEDGRIVRFLEKPTWGEVFSDTINTGIYIVQPEVLDLIPPKKNWDFSKNLFPAMLARGDRLLGYVAEGYWKDVGNLDEYLNVHLDLLAVHLAQPGLVAARQLHLLRFAVYHYVVGHVLAIRPQHSAKNPQALRHPYRSRTASTRAARRQFEAGGGVVLPFI